MHYNTFMQYEKLKRETESISASVMGKGETEKKNIPV
jgi:hypothetical protein